MILNKYNYIYHEIYFHSVHLFEIRNDDTGYSLRLLHTILVLSHVKYFYFLSSIFIKNVLLNNIRFMLLDLQQEILSLYVGAEIFRDAITFVLIPSPPQRYTLCSMWV